MFYHTFDEETVQEFVLTTSSLLVLNDILLSVFNNILEVSSAHVHYLVHVFSSYAKYIIIIVIIMDVCI